MPTKRTKVKALALNDKVNQLKKAYEKLIDNQKACELAYAEQPAFFDACRKQAAKCFEQDLIDILSN